MLRYEIAVASPADELLFDGLPRLQPVLDELAEGALLIGGLATAAWLTARPVGLPVRATRDVDLGIHQTALGIRGERMVLRPLLTAHGFVSGFAGEPFRFTHAISGAPFVVDLLVAKGSSRHDPPLLEAGLPSIAAPGLRYALDRGPVELQLALSRADEVREVRLLTITLDAAFVMKAALVASGARTRPDKRATDTADAIMLAAACADDAEAMSNLAWFRRQSEVKRAVAWLADSVTDPRSLAARRLSDVVGSDGAGAWAVAVAARFAASLEPAP